MKQEPQIEEILSRLTMEEKAADHVGQHAAAMSAGAADFKSINTMTHF